MRSSSTSSRFAFVPAVALVLASLVTAMAPQARASVPTITGCGLVASWNALGSGTAMSGAFPDSWEAPTRIALTASQSGGNAGEVYSRNWSALPVSDSAYTAGFLGTSMMAIYGTSVGVKYTMTFSHSVTDPVIMLNYASNTGSMDFGATSITLLDGNPAASVAANVVSLSSPGSNEDSDGYAVLVTGTFGPRTPLTFTYKDDSGATPAGTGGLGVAIQRFALTRGRAATGS